MKLSRRRSLHRLSRQSRIAWRNPQTSDVGPVRFRHDPIPGEVVGPLELVSKPHLHFSERRLMKPQYTECQASVWPHRHTDEMSGSLDIKISFHNQPSVAQGWPKKQPIWITLQQPDERTNLTLLQLRLALVKGVKFFQDDIDHPNLKWYRINHCRLRRDGTLKLHIKTRIINTVSHPIPRGKWNGTCRYTDRGCRFTFQAMTMRVHPKDEPRILLPDGSLPAKKNIKMVIP